MISPISIASLQSAAKPRFLIRYRRILFWRSQSNPYATIPLLTGFQEHHTRISSTRWIANRFVVFHCGMPVALPQKIGFDRGSASDLAPSALIRAARSQEPHSDPDPGPHRVPGFLRFWPGRKKEHRSGMRKPRMNGVGVADTKITIALPKDIDRQLRALAARRGQKITPIVREWIIETLVEIGSAPEAASRRSSRR
jgi:hypothetical protein